MLKGVPERSEGRGYRPNPDLIFTFRFNPLSGWGITFFNRPRLCFGVTGCCWGWGCCTTWRWRFWVRLPVKLWRGYLAGTQQTGRSRFSIQVFVWSELHSNDLIICLMTVNWRCRYLTSTTLKFQWCGGMQKLTSLSSLGSTNMVRFRTHSLWRVTSQHRGYFWSLKLTQKQHVPIHFRAFQAFSFFFFLFLSKRSPSCLCSVCVPWQDTSDTTPCGPIRTCVSWRELGCRTSQLCPLNREDRRRRLNWRTGENMA